MSDTRLARRQIETPTPTRDGRPPEQFTEDYFVYGVEALTVNSGATASGSIQIQADSMFLWERATFYATIANAAFTKDTQPIPNVGIQIVDSGSGRQLFRNQQPIPNVFGSGELPYLLPTPRYFKPNSQIQVTLTNFDAAVNYTIWLSFIGSKIFQYGQ